MNKYAVVTILLLCFSISILPATAQSLTIIAKSGSTPTIDGLIVDSEWNDASSVSFNGTQVFLKQDSKNLYIAFKAPIYPLSVMSVYIDVNNDRGLLLQSDDIAIGVANSNTLAEGHVVNNAWTPAGISGWTGISQTASNIVQAEFNVTYAKLNIVAGSNKTFGINFAYQTSSNLPTLGTVFTWSNPGNLAQPENNPSAWGIMNSNGYNWIPEFSSLLALSLLMMATLFLTIGYRHSHNKKSTL
jgi:hypothetical protein